MEDGMISRKANSIVHAIDPIHRLLQDPLFSSRFNQSTVSDFLLANPQELPLEDFTNALFRTLPPRDKDWFAYKMSEERPRHIIAASLRKMHGLSFDPQDIFLTPGSFAALAVSLGSVLDPGDEVIFITPSWFFYEALILSHNALAVRVPSRPDSFDLDLDAIQNAITPRTRGIIINTPNNPTGRIYPLESLVGLADLLEKASRSYDRRIFLFSDECYKRIIYDNRRFTSPAICYPASFIIYTYSKALLTPGERIGYIALPPSMPNREQLRPALIAMQMTTGYAFPDALLQYALPEFERLCINIPRLQRRRDLIFAALIEAGYQLHKPDGALYLLVRSPIPDDQAFARLLAEEGVLVLPGSLVELPGYFRMSLTANDDMVERALPIFASVKSSLPEPDDQPQEVSLNT
jgi:aspartate aminotransferase